MTPLLLLSVLPGAAVVADDSWVDLFDGRTLTGWKASEHPTAWQVRDGCLVVRGERSHLYYVGPVADHDFRNFELEVETKTEPGANSGVFFHTAYQETGWPTQGYEAQINNSYRGAGAYRELRCTGSLYAVRDLARRFVPDGEWFTMRLRVVGNRVRIHVNQHLIVDYLQPPNPPRSADRAGRLLSHGTFALQGHDPGSVASFRRVAVRVLPDDADAADPPRADDAGYGLTPGLMDRLAGSALPVIDFHVHLRGGMTPAKALARQAVTGLNQGVLENLGRGWPLETDDQLRTFLDGVAGLPLYVGVQVNDRDWFTRHSRELLDRLDYVLADTMIMAMPDDDSPPVKLWMPDLYTIDDPEAWIERYLRHTLRVISEPISILANPTYLPPAVKDRYDELWTDDRMRQVIAAAVDRGVALEIQAGSAFPSPRFLRMAKAMGAKFTFGSNNFDDRPISLARCFAAIEEYGLTKADLFVPEPRR